MLHRFFFFKIFHPSVWPVKCRYRNLVIYVYMIELRFDFSFFFLEKRRRS